VGTSYLTPADTALITQARRDILATKIAMLLSDSPAAVSLVLSRQDSSGQYQERPAQTVHRKISTNQPTTTGEETGTTEIRVSGNFQREDPFDVQVQDQFILENGWRGQITAVHPAKANIVQADWTASTGWGP